MLLLESFDLKRTPIDTLAIPVCSDRPIHTSRGVASLARRAAADPEFKAEPGDELVLHRPRGTRAERVLFLGLGKFEKLDAESLRRFAGQAVRRAMRRGGSRIRLAVPAPRRLGIDAAAVIVALLEGAALGNYRFDRFRGERKHQPLAEIGLLASPAEAAAHAGLPPRVEAICAGTCLAREWVNLPANEKRPEALARLMVQAAEARGVAAQVLDEQALEEAGFGALLAVGRGSGSPPCLVALEWAPRQDTGTTVLIGKGVTFDSGGLNLKGGESLSDMKIDMAGAAAVAAAVVSAARLDLGRRVVGLMPLVENMPSGDAVRPGDIVRSFAGKTVEINNTDAEGRLILADTISYALKTYAPRVLIDMATLTGACVVALGEKIAGLFTPDERLAAAILAAAGRTHERCWRLPLPEDYRELLKSETADLSNMSSSRWGGAISAALFLSHFVGESRWAHLDIAGPAASKKESDYCPAGGTGFGVRLLLDILEHL
jgi:leucyl aminopeptidase